ncbi:MAG TPA: sodium:solute symporter [Flavobacteriales bacterium]|nr:sodium:solute symporter [Flavobacteriales bacterium]
MSGTDWFVAVFTILFIVLYGIWKSRGIKNIDGFILADREMKWYHVGLSVMATQASAITFLSAPGQGYADGLQFVQLYFGLPIAMIIICIAFVPAFHNLNVYTAYEYLEKRFDHKTRTLTAFLFLFQRGISTGITIYAPALILSLILGIDINVMIVFTGVLIILYTVYGGTKAVSHTQVPQMIIIFAGLFLTAWLIIQLLPDNVSFGNALHIAGKMDHINAVNPQFDRNDKYNLWSGVIGGLFLHLSYFGTDQSQVGRYLTGSSVAQSRLGLIMNGLLKVPMQFLILLIGVLVFTFYQFHEPPAMFNTTEAESIRKGKYAEEFRSLEMEHKIIYAEKEIHVKAYAKALEKKDAAQIQLLENILRIDHEKYTKNHQAITALAKKHDPNVGDDSNFVFISFITKYLPVGVIGLLIAIIFLAAMGATASGINALTSTTIIDFYKRSVRKNETEKHYLSASRWITVGWGVFCIITAVFAGRIGNLIEAVNVLGSYFYGTILGIFLVAFYLKKVGGNAVFAAACIAEVFIVYAGYNELVAFLWLNIIGCFMVMLLAYIFEQPFSFEQK